ncbi:MAG: hypothetical protein EXQ85_03395 [Alphaproteobacteria bacterium]|nr:hypothetical protein [Alphaproteobacteria bacterium]
MVRIKRLGPGLRAATRWFTWAVLLLAAGCAAPSLDPEWARYVDFRNELSPSLQAVSERSGASSFPLRSWRAEEQAAFLAQLQAIRQKAPGLIDRAAAPGPVPIYRVDRATGQAHGLETLAGSGAGVLWIYNSFPLEQPAQVFDSLSHELVHVADAHSRIARSPEFRQAVEPRICDLREGIKKAGFADWREALAARRDDLARQVGLPNLYAATAVQEALAEYVSYALADRGFKLPADVAAILDRRVFSLPIGEDVVGLALLRAQERVRAGRAEEAMPDLAMVLEREPGNAEALGQRGLALATKGNFAGARADLSAALEAMAEFDAMRPLLLAARAQAAFGTAQYATAIDDAATALAINPALLPALIIRAAAFHRQKEFGRAVADLNTALDRSPDYRALYLMRADAKGALGDNLGAIDDLTRVLAKEPTARAFLSRALYLGKVRRVAEAREDVDQALRLDPSLGREADGVRRGLTGERGGR